MIQITKTTICCLVSLSLPVGCGGQQSAPTHPERGALEPFTEPVIAISPPDSSGTFHFSFCGQSTDSPLIGRIVVSPAGETVTSSFNGASTNCVWKKDGGVPLGGEWKYGSSPQGSKLSGACPPFQNDRTYEIIVSGSGSGSLEFRVTVQGTSTAVKSTCPTSTSEIHGDPG
jgi:hypothetical protein